MRGISRVVIARDAADGLRQAVCKGQQELWDRGEREHAEVVAPPAAQAAARPLLQLCRRCPHLTDGTCAAWAEADNYTGIAAGTAWTRGRRRRVDDPPALDNAPRERRTA